MHACGSCAAEIEQAHPASLLIGARDYRIVRLLACGKGHAGYGKRAYTITGSRSSRQEDGAARAEKHYEQGQKAYAACMTFWPLHGPWRHVSS